MKKLTKKITAVALAAVMVGGVLAGCSAAKDNGDDQTAEVKTYKIGICQLVTHDALDAATKGFQDKLTELGEANGVKFEFDYQNASGDSTNCSTIANKFVSSQYDLIMANATPALQACVTATAASKTPVVGTSVTDYAAALDIQMGPTDATGINVTGTSDLAPLDKQAQQIMDLFPETKKVGVIYCSAEANSKPQADGVKEALAAKGVECEYYAFSDSNDISAVAKKAAAEVDVIYVPTDNTAASNGAVIDDACKNANTPVIAGEEGIFTNTNAVATLSISYYALGQTTAEMAYDILVNGKDPATMNIQQTSGLTYKYNEAQAKAFNAIIPDGYEAATAE
ncbi:ABC transporter substrate-binding protein [uncultured Eubacterium sp.]|uniref:ABC transporter substrate-binding protein n=1 Tax=uncultured Eubacterium sp. TaxID=165185 RepID=UPI0025D55EA1|nr:ABC transporter substrate-binding protein [uncultured Eubacterium sp.]